MVNIGFCEIKFFKQLSLLVFENYKTIHFQRHKLLIFFFTSTAQNQFVISVSLLYNHKGLQGFAEI